MSDQNWLVTDDGDCFSFESADLVLTEQPYRLYRFLSELEDILAAAPDDRQRILQIVPLVRQLLTSSYWLQLEFDPPSAKTGWSVRFLYREYEFPLTVQMVAWAPGQRSKIHNHAAWGIVALVGGQEKNHLWRRAPSPEQPDRLEKAGEQLLLPGDIIGFMPGAIHAVEPLGEEPTVSFNLYGETNFQQRYQFDIEQHTAERY
ncbi:MAG: cupin [Leptolyngbya sp. SIO4C1]|nr:cupin [Leptolyngbya sp. SIO4C1]